MVNLVPRVPSYPKDPRRCNNFTLDLHAEISARELCK